MCVVGQHHLGKGLLRTPVASPGCRPLAKTDAEGRLEEKLPHFAKPKLLIVDELTCLPFELDVAHLFFQFVGRRYERGEMLATFSRAVGEWATVFGNPVVAIAILAGMLHHNQVVTHRGESYRRRKEPRPFAKEQREPVPS